MPQALYAAFPRVGQVVNGARQWVRATFPRVPLPNVPILAPLGGGNPGKAFRVEGQDNAQVGSSLNGRQMLAFRVG